MNACGLNVSPGVRTVLTPKLTRVAADARDAVQVPGKALEKHRPESKARVPPGVVSRPRSEKEKECFQQTTALSLLKWK